MQSLLALSAVLVLATACASNPPPKTAWTQPGASAAELDDAKKACLADTAALETHETSEWLNARLAGNRFVRCLEERGWTRVAID